MHKLGGFEGGDKPVLVVVLSWEISIYTTTKYAFQKTQKLNIETKFDGMKYKLWV